MHFPVVWILMLICDGYSTECASTKLFQAFDTRQECLVSASEALGRSGTQVAFCVEGLVSEPK